MKPHYLALLIAPLFSTAALAAGGYTGPGASQPVTTVAAALEAADDTPVVLQGQIVKRLKGETYEFRDATGTLKAEIDDDEWPPQAIGEQATVRLSGEVDRDLGGREIDVEIVEPIGQ